MDLISLILILVAIGVILWLINTFIPMDGNIKKIINAVVIIAVVLFILSLFVNIPSIKVGR